LAPDIELASLWGGPLPGDELLPPGDSVEVLLRI